MGVPKNKLCCNPLEEHDWLILLELNKNFLFLFPNIEVILLEPL